MSGSWPAGSSATFTRNVPPPSNAPDRFTAHAMPPPVGSSSSSARAAAFWPAASASKKVIDLVAVASQERELGGREGGAQRGDGAGEPVLMAHEAVDVAFHEERPILRLDRGAREVGGVEQVALGVERRLRRVEILRLLVAERAAAEGDDPALQVADREEQAPAEAIVRPGAVLARDREAGGDEDLLGDLLRAHEAPGACPSPRGRSRGRSAGRSRGRCRAARDRRAPARRTASRALRVEARRELHRPEQLLPARIAALAALVWQRDAGRPGERADGLGEREAILAHQEAERVAARPRSRSSGRCPCAG